MNAANPLDDLKPEEEADLGDETPISRQYPDPPDPAAYCGLPGDIVRVISPQSEADPVAILSQALTCFGNCVGRTPFFQVEADRHAANLFLLIVGATSKGRKGTSFGQVRRIFDRVDPDWTRDRIRSGVASGEGIISEVRDPVVVQEPIKEKGRVIGYQMVQKDSGVEDKRLLILAPEFSLVLKVASREGNIVTDVLRQAWESGLLRTMSKNSPLKATDAHISLVGHITIAELKRELDATDMANGTVNRFLVHLVKRSKCLPEGGYLAEEVIDELAARVSEAVKFARTVTRMHRDDEARRMWAEVYPELADGKLGLIGAVLGRGEAQVMRLSMLYALMDGRPVIEGRHLEAALALWQYSEASARFIFGDALGDPTADQILRSLRLVRGDGLTRTEISGLFKRHKDGKEIERALMVLA